MAKTVLGRTNRGITLLEVLISIGILAIGLMGTLALIPAGGSYLRKAQKESRAAALIPNAFDVMKTSNLFSENALLWLVDYDEHDEVERFLRGYPGYPNGTDYQSPDAATILEYYQPRDDAPDLKGQVPDDDLSEITITITGPNGPLPPFNQTPDADGKWEYDLQSTDLELSDPPESSEEEASIVGSGSNPRELQEYFDEWSFEVDRGTINVVPPNEDREPNSSSASNYRHYRKKREEDKESGYVHLDFSFPLYGYDTDTHATNDDLDSAEVERVPTGYDKVIRRFKGSLWRYEFGRRRGRYDQEREYGPGFSGEKSQPVIATGDLNHTTYGNEWVDGSWNPKEAHPDDPTGRTKSDEFPYKSNTVDRYEIRTDKDEYPIYQGQQFEVDWGDEPDGLNPGEWDKVWKNALSDRYKDEADREHPDPFFVSLNDSAIALVPTDTTASSYLYTAPGDGFLDLKTELRNVLEEDEDGNDLSLTAEPNNWRLNHLQGNRLPYDFEVTIFGPHRVALVDPLMCSQIEYVAAEWARVNGVSIAQHPLYQRIRKAAEFYQYSSVIGQTVPFVMRRMNWNIVANQTGVTPTGVNPTLAALRKLAVAESLCRPADVLEVELPDDPLAASEPRYEYGEVSANDNAPVYRLPPPDTSDYCSETGQPCATKQIPLRRQVDDRLSWMLTIQPEGDGTIPATWRAGNYFDVAIVVFQNRLLPPVGATTIEGENFFNSWWNDETGFLTLSIDQSSGIDQDDIRRMFAAGNFVMVAPKRANYNQKIDWLEIQNAEFTRLPDKTIVEIIPTAEPDTNTTLGSPDFYNDEPANLVTLVYQGVVAVSRHSVQITE